MPCRLRPETADNGCQGTQGSNHRSPVAGTLGSPLDIHETDELDEDQLTSWIEQASQLPGEQM